VAGPLVEADRLYPVQLTLSLAGQRAELRVIRGLEEEHNLFNKNP